MRFSKETKSGVHIFKLMEIKLDTSNSGLLKGELSDSISHLNIKKMILDLCEVINCDSSGLSVLLVAKRLIDDNDGSIVIVPSEKIKKLIEITKLDRALQISGSVESAMLMLE